jgi:hypothetical protein
MQNEGWANQLFSKELVERAGGNIGTYKLGKRSELQEQAVREFAINQGFSNLRGFNKWMENAELNYYDILKIQSPE